MKIILLGKRNCPYTDLAEKYIRRHNPDTVSFLSEWGDTIPERKIDPHIRGAVLISFLSRWIIPDYILNDAKYAINFHPASPEYPGIGCNNFALYDNAKEYGCTCHHMEPKVDTGMIIDVRKFPVFQTDNVESLLNRTYDIMLGQFYDVIGHLLKTGTLPIMRKPPKWARSAYTRKEFEKLFVVTADMKSDEIDIRVRALSYKNWRPYVIIDGRRFVYESKVD